MADTPSFANLVPRLRAGDDEAARQVFDRFAHRLIALAQTRLHRNLRAKVDPESVVQEAYGSLYTRLAGGEFELNNWENLWAVLAVITLRKCANRAEYWDAQRRDVRRELPLQPAAADDSGPAWEGTGREPTPDAEALLNDTLAELTQGMDQRERDILELSVQGYSVQEISEKLQRAERTVRRVREHIRKRLERMRDQAE
jgi:RNA polymerase sigma-70 factor (ECF subfamily)